MLLFYVKREKRRKHLSKIEAIYFSLIFSSFIYHIFHTLNELSFLFHSITVVLLILLGIVLECEPEIFSSPDTVKHLGEGSN